MSPRSSAVSTSDDLKPTISTVGRLLSGHRKIGDFSRSGDYLPGLIRNLFTLLQNVFVEEDAPAAVHLLFGRNFSSIDFYGRNSLHTTEVYALCLEHAPYGRDHAGSLAALSPYGRAIENHSQHFHGSNWHVLETASHSRTPLFSCTDQPLPSHFPPQKGRPIPGRLEMNPQAPLGCLHTTRRQRKTFPAW